MATKKKATSAKARGGDTSRTSSQGRKLASGGNKNSKGGDDEIDESSKAPVKAVNKKKSPAGKRK